MIEALEHPFKADYHVPVFEVWNPLQRTLRTGVDAAISLFLCRFFFSVQSERRCAVAMSAACIFVDRGIFKNTHCMPAGCG